MTAYQAVVLLSARECVCKHRHRSELAAFDCGCREVRRRVNRLLHGAPRPDSRFFRISTFTREVQR